jgi:PIN domain nuclease of toxin-antitoxin system
LKYVVDTHPLIWLLEGRDRLGDRAKAILVDRASEIVLPAIAFAESVWIVSRGKTSIPSVADLLDAIYGDARIEIFPLDRAVVEKTLALTAINEMHDRQIVATALVIQDTGERVALLTCDRNITASNIVPVIW